MATNIQVLGQNDEAQQIIKDTITEYFPTLEASDDISTQIIDKFFDWRFPFEYTDDGGGAKRWSISVRAWCARNKKLSVLEAFFDASGTDGTFKEAYSGQDTTTVTDTRKEQTTDTADSTNSGTDTTTTEEQYNPINTPSSKLSGKTTTTATPNTSTHTERTAKREALSGNMLTVYARGISRQYSDGRTWTEILADVAAAQEPIYAFINGFAQILVPPDACYLPECGATVAARVGAVVPVDTNAAAVRVRNQGTPSSAVFVFDFDVPQGVGIKNIKITEV